MDTFCQGREAEYEEFRSYVGPVYMRRDKQRIIGPYVVEKGSVCLYRI